jgi:hypothetical protein
MFAMIFTAGLGFFVFVAQEQKSQAQANQIALSQSADKAHEVLGILPSTDGASPSHWGICVSNTGGVAAQIIDVFVTNPTSGAFISSPNFLATTQLGINSVSSCGNFASSSLSSSPSPSTFTLNVGASAAIDTPVPSTACTSSNPCDISVLTGRGNIFQCLTNVQCVQVSTTGTQLITTLLSQSAATPTGTVNDTATLAGVTPSPGDMIKFYYSTSNTCPLSTATPAGSVTFPHSPPYQSSTVGPGLTGGVTYYFYAQYLVGGTTLLATSPCEPLSVIAPTQTNNVQCSTGELNGQFCVAAAAFGFGFLSFNFNTFNLYTLAGSSCSAQGSYPSSSCSKLDFVGLGYTIPTSSPGNVCDQNNNNCLFSADITNVDPNQRDLLIDQNTYIQQAIIPEGTGSGQGAGAAIWQIACVQAGSVTPWGSGGAVGLGQSCGTSNGITVHYGQTATLFFTQTTPAPDQVAASKWNNFLHETPTFMLFHGALVCAANSLNCNSGSSALFAENIPFTTTLWPSSFTWPPAIFDVPTSGPPTGNTITIYGGSFAASSTITIKVDGFVVPTTPALCKTDVGGAFTCSIAFSGLAGSHSIQATDASSNTASTVFFVASPLISISPSTGPSGTSVRVTGTGFLASSTITLSYGLTVVATSPTTCTSDSTGSFTCTFTVPAGLSGTYVVTAKDGGSNKATALYTQT